MFKYLFKALITDPSKENGFYYIEQNQEDKGLVEGRNCFYDVLQVKDKLRAFALYNQETNEEWVLDLSDGHFEHNFPTLNIDTGEVIYQGSSFKLHGELELENLRLIWFIRRQMLLDVVNTKVVNNVISSYNFGFQANLKTTGENKEFVITLV